MDEAGMRRRSVGSVEINDSQGRRKTVDINELSEADRQLAAQFGYQPVCDHNMTHVPRRSPFC